MKFLHTLTKGGLLVALLLLCNFAMAQRTVKGKVTDSENGDGLIGASVSVVGTTRGTATDIDGNYTIEVPAGSTQIRFAYTGYVEQVITLGTAATVDVSMKTGSVLDEVVVIGYGAVKKSDLTGSVASVSEKEFNKGLITSPDQLIQGKVAGVQIINNSGQPGGTTTVRIRGNSSVRSGSQPLYVIDGIQLTGISAKPGADVGDIGTSPGSNPLNFIPPGDIESIQVLKDASATAIYGSRGANGVILVTTKRGKSGVPSIDFNTSVGAGSILKKYDVLSADEYRSALTEYGSTSGDYGADVDAQDEITRTGITQNHGLSIGGGTDAGSYRVGLSYMNQEGILKQSDLRRTSANISGSFKFLESKKLGIDFGVLASHARENGPSIGTSSGFQGSLVSTALQWNPTHPMYKEDGSPVVIPAFGNSSINPVALLKAYSDKINTTNIIASISPSFKFTDHFSYKMFYSIDYATGDRRTQLSRFLNLQNVENRGLASFSQARTTNQIITHTLNYDTKLGSSVNMNVVVGYEYQKLTNQGNGVVGRDFLIEDFDYVAILQNSTTGSRNVYGYADPNAELQSYFARGFFSIKDKYLVTATVRADGSSKFGENNQVGIFPAVGLAWNAHNEAFLEDGPFNNLKVRLGWGITGNSEFPAGAAQDRYGFGLQTIALENVANPDLKWETSTTFNAGIDFGILKGKLTGSIDYFNKSTEDLLFQFPTIQPAPAGFYWINLPGKVINSGVEAAINYVAVDNGDFNWTISPNISFLKNELQDYTGPALDYGQLFGQGSSGATSQRLANGQPLNAFYLRQHIGIGADGQSQYVDDEALAFVGDPNADVLLGISTYLTKGKLSLGVSFNGAYGHQIFNNTKMSVIPIGNVGTRNIDASLLDGDVQEAKSNAIKASTRYLENGDYLKLTNATLAYNFGNIGKSFRNARVYISGSNLLVFTKYSGFDPEVNTVNSLNGLPSLGIEYAPYPSARTIILGANFSF